MVALETHPFATLVGIDETVANQALSEAMSRGAEFADLYFQHTRTTSLMLFLYAVTFSFAYSSKGAFLAILSGALASGLGYIFWYSALRDLTATRAATVQLAVPVIAAAGGVFFLAEAVTLRLTLSTLAILGGVGLAISSRTK